MRIDDAAAPALCAAWLELSDDLLVLTGGDGRIVWANAAFVAAAGAAAGDALAPWLAGPEGEERLLHAPGREPRPVRLRSSTVGAGRLWVMQDLSAQHALQARERALAERLEVAQEFGRLGVWERRIPSGEGLWDRHVFGFWGLDPAGGTPAFLDAMESVHPDDRRTQPYLASTTRAGRYSQRFRVLRADGSVRRIHSQWEVKAGADGRPERAVGVMLDDTEAHELARSLDATTMLLGLTVDLCDIVHWHHDLKTGLMHYNANGFKALGLEVRSAGMPIDEVRALTHPDDLPRVLASAQRALQSDLPDDVEARYWRRDGSWRNMQSRRIVQRAADGTPIGFVGVSLDVTEQLRRQRVNEDLMRRFESATAAGGLGIWSRDVATGEVRWNRQMYQITGRSPEQGPPAGAGWIEQIVRADDRAAVRQELAQLRLESGELARIEYRVERPDGQTRWLENRFRLEQVDGRATVLGVTIDVTDRRRAEDALRSADERAALAARAAGIGTWEVDFDAQRRIVAERWDAQMFVLRGLVPRERAPSREERLAQIHPDDRQHTIDGFENSEAAKGPQSYEFRLLMPDGSERWLASRSIIVRADPRQPARRVGINWDVTESKHTETARREKALAEQQSRAKSEFLSRVSHELRTPLNAVLGFTGLLQLEAAQAGSAGQLAKLGHIRAAGEHLLALIDDVLELSGLESGQLPLAAQPVELAALLADTLPQVDAMARRHQVSVRSAPQGAVLIGDPRRLRQVLVNLLSHAVESSRPGGEVWVEADADAGRVRLRVHDAGRGLGAAQVAQLFEPFNRPGVGQDGGGGGGGGLGLVIVKALVEAMGGRIGVVSGAGGGTVFELNLPGHAALAPAEPTPATPTAAPGSGGQLLYIEDNPVNVLLVEELVTRLTALRIESAVTGTAGVARARELQPDLVLVDMQLPDFDGFEVLRRLRADPATRGLRCVALSANAMAEDIERALAAGFVDYWTKPIDFAAFLAALQRLFKPS